MRAGSNLPSIPWTERERAEFKRRITALESGGGRPPAGGSFTLDDGTATAGGVFILDDGGA